jgi:hypothetical protein
MYRGTQCIAARNVSGHASRPPERIPEEPSKILNSRALDSAACGFPQSEVLVFGLKKLRIPVKSVSRKYVQTFRNPKPENLWKSEELVGSAGLEPATSCL